MENNCRFKALYDFIFGFMEYLSCEHDIGRFPKLNKKQWHILLFSTKSKFGDDYPELECIGEIDWREKYPRVSALIEFADEIIKTLPIVRDDTRALTIELPIGYKRKIDPRMDRVYKFMYQKSLEVPLFYY